MTIIRVRLCDSDREQYGVDADLTVDTETLKDLTADELVAIEEEMELPLAVFVEQFESGPLSVSRTRQVAAWLAVKQAGVDVRYGGFKPRLLRAVIEREATLPNGGASESSSEDAPDDSSSPT